MFNRARSTWNFLWVEEGQRKSRKLGTLAELPTRAGAIQKAETVRRELRLLAERSVPTVRQIVEQYRVEKMPKRFSTSRGYECWLRNYIIPRWGGLAITDLKPRPVEQWLESLKLSPKSRSHVRGLLHKLWAFAMWSEVVPVQANPMSLVTVRGSSRRQQEPRSLTVEEFRKFVWLLGEPFRTIALIGVCFGLRISECLALKWSDVDWLSGKLSIERGIVRQRVDDVKTIYSGRDMSIDAEMIGVLKAWRQSTQFASEDDWVFASPVKLGRQPWSYDQVWRSFLNAAESGGIGKLGTHTMRHTYRSWLDAVGTPIAVQQKLMRHGDIRTTMNTYGDVVTDEMSQAHSKVVRLALSRTN